MLIITRLLEVKINYFIQVIKLVDICNSFKILSNALYKEGVINNKLYFI
jgi:hypothetical protein